MMAHVLMVTPLRDGLSLASHEAVACQGDHVTTEGEVWRGNKAPLILSEFAGASTALGGSIIVNPHDVHDVAVCDTPTHFFYFYCIPPVSYPGIQILSLGGVSLFFCPNFFFSTTREHSELYIFFFFAEQKKQGISLDFGFFPELGFLNFFFLVGL